MNKQPDFGKDLAALNDNVTAEVGDMLEVLRQKKASAAPKVHQDVPTEHPDIGPGAAKETAEDRPHVERSTRPSSRGASRSKLKPVIERDTILENVTTRLSRVTNELLTEAALRQRLKKVSPATRQDIVEVALQDWFRKHGYAADRSDEGD